MGQARPATVQATEHTMSVIRTLRTTEAGRRLGNHFGLNLGAPPLAGLSARILS